MKALVISGTLGAGKTFAASAVRDLLAARGERVAVLDLDWLCQLEPAPVGDPYNDALAFANLAAVWPNYVEAGVAYLVIARVVENAGDRQRYERALLRAQVRIVRVVASAQTCRARLTAREPEGFWREGHLARTDELAERLANLELEDLTVNNEGRTGDEVALEILGQLDW